MLVTGLTKHLYNAAALYYHKESVLKFLSSWPNPNNLLKAVQEDLSNEVYLAEVRALGIIDKLLTGPLWRLVENCKSILELNPYLLRLKIKLSEFCKDASSLLTPYGRIFDDQPPIEYHEDDIYIKLFEDSNNIEFDILTQQAL